MELKFYSTGSNHLLFTFPITQGEVYNSCQRRLEEVALELGKKENVLFIYLFAIIRELLVMNVMFLISLTREPPPGNVYIMKFALTF